MKKERLEYDYYIGDQFLFHLGHICYRKAHSPMPLHSHKDMIEFVYLEKGKQNYQTQTNLYTVNPGEVFFTKPNEVHSTGFLPEEISSFYYMIVDLALLPRLHVFTSEKEYAKLNLFFASEERITKASDSLPGAFKNLLKCFATKDEHFDTHVRNALSEVLIAISTPYEVLQEKFTCNIARSLEYIHAHPEESIRVATLAHIENMSLSTYHKCFSKTIGISPAEYILKIKIEKTKELLRETDISITEIAHQYDFSSSQYFSTVFKRFCYITPTQYRKNAKKGM